ncbi:MAG: UPF0175 family protein [Planctomycetes bacterium]|nr:UPF0175 family protein [Planctomycetota bacterium]
MATIQVTVPDSAFSALRRSPHDFAAELRLAGSIHWYQQGQISMERAAEIAGMDRRGYLEELARRRVDVFQVDIEDLKREISGGRAAPIIIQ